MSLLICFYERQFLSRGSGGKEEKNMREVLTERLQVNNIYKTLHYNGTYHIRNVMKFDTAIANWYGILFYPIYIKSYVGVVFFLVWTSFKLLKIRFSQPENELISIMHSSCTQSILLYIFFHTLIPSLPVDIICLCRCFCVHCVSISLYGSVSLPQQCACSLSTQKCVLGDNTHTICMLNEEKSDKNTEKKIESLKVFIALRCVVLCCILLYCIALLCECKWKLERITIVGFMNAERQEIGSLCHCISLNKIRREKKKRAQTTNQRIGVPVVLCLWLTIDNKSFGLPAVGYLQLYLYV